MRIITAVLLFYFLYWGFGTVHIVNEMQEEFKYKKYYIIYKKNLIENAYNKILDTLAL